MTPPSEREQPASPSAQDAPASGRRISAAGIEALAGAAAGEHRRLARLRDRRVNQGSFVRSS